MEKRIPGLDGLRALSAVAVLCMHVGLLSTGWLGVQVFYVISGFLITRILLAADHSTPLGQQLARFYYRRSLRIFPLFYLYLLVVALVAPSLRGQHGLFLSLATYTYNIRRASSGYEPLGLITHLWSLAVEEQFYLIWPFIIFFVSRKHFRAITLAVLLLSPVARFLLLNFGHGNSLAQIYFLTPFQLDGFAAGAFLSTLTVTESRRLQKPLWTLLAVTVISVAVWNRHLPALGFAWLMPAHGMSAWGYTIVDALAAAAILLCINRTRVAHLLDWYPLRQIGRISYGFYIWHIAGIELADIAFRHFSIMHNHRALSLVVAFVLDLLIASCSYSLFETRILRYKESFFPARNTPVEPAEIAGP